MTFDLRKVTKEMIKALSRMEGNFLTWWIVCTLTIDLVLSQQLDYIQVNLSVGKLRGSRRRENYDMGTGSKTDTIDQYLGVIYAEPPVEALRFKPPRPARPWSGVLDCTQPGWVCPQKPYYTQTEVEKQNEDCLNLNIYSPLIKNSAEVKEQYPVMVYIHGGSYEEGAANRYDGFCLATHGVVVVTINYRLGPLGFLSNGDCGLPGNYGILDQIEALKWIRAHIHHFRGNPNDVTIFGSSAGASSVGLLLVSPKSRGLFHGVIIQSGPPLSFWAVYNRTVDHAAFTRQVAKRVGCQNEAMEAIVDCLRHVPYSAFIEQHIHYPRIVPSDLNFKPLIDGDVLPAFPEVALLSGRHHDVPVMIGVMEEEWARSMGWFFREIRKKDGMDSNYRDGMDRDSFERAIDHVITKRFWWPSSVADVIKHAYTDWTNVTHPIQNRVNYVNFMSDLTMVAPSVKTASILAKQGTQVYMYKFHHDSIHSDQEWWGSYHSLELDYVFGSPFNGYDIAADKYVNHTLDDKTLSRAVMKMWSNFAKYKNPTPPPESLMWQRFNPNTTNYLDITPSSLSNKEHLRADKVALWNTLIPKLLPDHNARVLASQKGMTSKINYEILSWVLLGSCILFVSAFAIVSWRFMIIKKQVATQGNDRYYNNGQPPQMV